MAKCKIIIIGFWFACDLVSHAVCYDNHPCCDIYETIYITKFVHAVRLFAQRGRHTSNVYPRTYCVCMYFSLNVREEPPKKVGCEK